MGIKGELLSGVISKGKQVKDAIARKLNEYEKAHKIAQENAALPVEKGGLGLPPDNTAMDRARAMGFVNAFHGTADDITKIDKNKFGKSTGAESAKKAFFAVDDPTTARGYAEYAAKDSKVKEILDAADKAEAKGKWNEYDRLIEKAEKLESDFYNQPNQGQNIMPLMIREGGGAKVSQMDAAGAEFVDVEGGVNKFIDDAIKNKSDVAVIKQLSDDVGFSDRPATHYAVINPSLVRSKFAAFDPFKKESSNLLASLGAGTTVGAGLMATPDDAEAGIVSRNIPRAAGIAAGSLAADAVFSEDPAQGQSTYTPSTAIDAYIRKRNERRAGPKQLQYERMAGNPVQTIEAPQGVIREASGWAGEQLGEFNRRLEGSPLELVSPTGMEDYLKKYAYAEASPLDAALAAFDLGLLTAPKAMLKSLPKP